MCKNISRLVLFAAIASLTVSAVSNGALQAQEGLFNALRGGEAKQVAARARTEAGEERSANSSRAVRLQEMNREASNLYKLRSTGELVLSSMHESCPQLAQLHVTGRGGEERVRVVDLEREEEVAKVKGAYAHYCVNDKILTYSAQGVAQVFDRTSQTSRTLKLSDELNPARQGFVEVRGERGEASGHLLIAAELKGGGGRRYALFGGDEEGTLHHVKLPGIEVLEDAVRYEDAILLLGWTRHEEETASGARRAVIRHSVVRVTDELEVLYRGDEGEVLRLLDGGQVFVAHADGATLVSVDGAQERIHPAGECAPSSRTIVEVLVTSPAALFMCAKERPGAQGRYDVTFLHWTPEGDKTIEVSDVGWLSHWRYGGTQHDLMTAEAPIFSFTEDRHVASDRAGSSVLFDMERGEVWRSQDAPMYVLSAQSVQHHARRVLLSDEAADLGRRSKGAISLYLKDFSGGGLQQVYTYKDCPGGLEVEPMGGEFVGLHCMSNHTKKLRFYQQWSELIDLDTLTRWRIPETRQLTAMLPEGRVVYSSMRRGDRIKDRLPRELRVVTLK